MTLLKSMLATAGVWVGSTGLGVGDFAVLGTGAELNPVILGQPAVSDSVTAGILTPLVVLGTVSWTTTWYVGQQWTANNAGALVGTGATMSFTGAHVMQQVWAKCSATVNGTPVEYYSARQWVHPTVGMTADAHAGAPADDATTSDPDDATAYSASTLYKLGRVVYEGANKYVCYDAYSYGDLPSTSPAKWMLIAQTWYVDSTAPGGGTGTKASPYTLREVQERTAIGYSGGANPLDKTLVLLKRGQSHLGPWYMRFYSPRTLFASTYGSGARPVIKYACNQAWFDLAANPTSIVFGINYSQTSGFRAVNIEVDAAQSVIAYGDTATISGSFSEGNTITFAGGATGYLRYKSVRGTSTYLVIEINERDLPPSSVAGPITSPASWSPTINLVIGFVSTAGSTPAQNVGLRGCVIRNCTETGQSFGSTVGGSGAGFFATESSIINCCTKKSSGSGGLDCSENNQARFFFNTVEDCGTLTNNVGNHQTYCSGSGQYVAHLFNKFRVSLSGANHYGNCGLMMHGVFSDVDWAWNYIDGARGGISVNSGYETYESFLRIRVFSNYISGRQKPVTASLDIANAHGLILANNLLVDTSHAFVRDSRDATADDRLTDAVVAGNTFVNAGPCFGTYDGGLNGELVNFSHYNNVQVGATIVGGSGLIDPYVISGGTPPGEVHSSHNAVYGVGANKVMWWAGGVATRYATLAAFNAAHPEWENNSLDTDPLLTNVSPGAVNALPQSGSPLIASGIDVRRLTGIGCDYAGVARPDVPTRGALEPA